ncbi:Alpha/Beta hydrolase protein [Mycena epipterygia]|nr:Alpha/Beta hydrolase protein [Mycena epipterygia]
MDSGTALFNQSVVQTKDTAQIIFAEVTAQLSCGGAASQIDCLHGVSWQPIVTLLTSSGLSFVTVPDDRVVFTDYTARHAAGVFARVPALIGTNQHELNALLPHFPGGPFNDDSILDLQTNKSFLCFSAFPGAYHASELLLIFGTAGQYHSASTAYEDDVSVKMQDLWLAFARDPLKGLQGAGWEPHAVGKAVLLGDADALLKQIDVQDLDCVCSGF